MTKLTKAEADKLHLEFAEAADALAQKFAAVCPDQEMKQQCVNIGVAVYEGHRKLEEFMHRVGDLLGVMCAMSDENVMAKIARGNFKVVEGGKADG